MKKAMFIDRDGVLNKKPPEHDYVKKSEELLILPGVEEALSLIKRSGYLAIVISNQRGVARGMMKEADVQEINKSLNEKIGNNIDAFYCCFHDKDSGCECRKPKPGLILQAIRELDIDIDRSWFVGDSDSDMQAASAAGVKGIKIKTDGDLFSEMKKLTLTF